MEREHGFGVRLRRLRRAAGLSVYKLALRSGVTAASIFRIEKHGAEPRWVTICKLADALAVSIDDFRKD